MRIRIFMLASLLVILVSSCVRNTVKDNNPLKYPDKLPKVVSERIDTTNGIIYKTYYFDEGISLNYFSERSFRTVYYNMAGQVVMLDGTAEIIVMWNKTEEGIEELWTYYDDKRNPIICNQGMARERVLRTKDGKVIETSFYNEKGLLIYKSTEGYAKCVNELNDQGNIIHTIRYNSKMEVIEPITEYIYSTSNDVVRINYLNTEHQLMLNEQGVAYKLIDHDKNGIIQESFHSLSGKLATPIGTDAALLKYIYVGDSYNTEKYNKNNELINVDFGEVKLDTSIDNHMFSDPQRVNNVLEFIVNAKFDMHNTTSDAYGLISSWNLITDNSYTSSNLNSLFDINKWKQKKIEIFQKSAWDYYGAVTYLGEHKEMLLSVFEKIAPLLTQHISSKNYYESGLNNLVNILMAAYNDIYSQSFPEERLSRIYNLMAENEDSEYVADLHPKLEAIMDSPLVRVDVSQHKYDEEEIVRKSIEVWAYSFWARRYNEGIIDPAIQILTSIQAMYQ